MAQVRARLRSMLIVVRAVGFGLVARGSPFRKMGCDVIHCSDTFSMSAGTPIMAQMQARLRSMLIMIRAIGIGIMAHDSLSALCVTSLPLLQGWGEYGCPIQLSNTNERLGRKQR